MTEDEKTVIRHIIGALRVPRDRLGRLSEAHGRVESERMREDGVRFKLPHGGYDRTDKAVMLLQALVGDQPWSIMDDKPRSAA